MKSRGIIVSIFSSQRHAAEPSRQGRTHCSRGARYMGIRKVLGASVRQIVQLLSHDFVKVIVIAAILAIPAAYFTINEWLSTYPIRINLNVWMFTLPIVIILAMALVTVSFQTIKTALSNPVDSLKQE